MVLPVVPWLPRVTMGGAKLVTQHQILGPLGLIQHNYTSISLVQGESVLPSHLSVVLYHVSSPSFKQASNKKKIMYIYRLLYRILLLFVYFVCFHLPVPFLHQSRLFAPMWLLSSAWSAVFSLRPIRAHRLLYAAWGLPCTGSLYLLFRTWKWASKTLPQFLWLHLWVLFSAYRFIAIIYRLFLRMSQCYLLSLETLDGCIYLLWWKTPRNRKNTRKTNIQAPHI